MFLDVPSDNGEALPGVTLAAEGGPIEVQTPKGAGKRKEADPTPPNCLTKPKVVLVKAEEKRRRMGVEKELSLEELMNME